MTTATEEKVGLFIASYRIGGDMPGAPTFTVNLSVYTPAKKVSGAGHITQAVNPPVNIGTRLEGEYTYMCVMPHNCHILVKATGYPIIKWPKHGGVGPVILPNAELWMVLEEDWSKGQAHYNYMDAEGNWHEVENATVEQIEPEKM